jgi:hypothetical protein
MTYSMQRLRLKAVRKFQPWSLLLLGIWGYVGAPDRASRERAAVRCHRIAVLRLSWIKCLISVHEFVMPEFWLM